MLAIILVFPVSKIDLVGKKGKELQYPTYAPHIILDTNKSILDEIYLKYTYQTTKKFISHILQIPCYDVKKQNYNSSN